jgi:hypothetical protein
MNAQSQTHYGVLRPGNVSLAPGCWLSAGCGLGWLLLYVTSKVCSGMKLPFVLFYILTLPLPAMSLFFSKFLDYLLLRATH